MSPHRPSLDLRASNPILFTDCMVCRTIRAMYTILRSATFDRWLGRLRDRHVVNRIVARLLAAEDGHLGDVRPVGDGVSEMRIQHGPGYRVYFITRGAELIVLLCGGDKDSQRRDIERAKRMATEWRS